MLKNIASTLSVTVLAVIVLTACAPLEADVRIGVKQDAKTCELTQTDFAAGVATFVIENIGDATSEFYILKEDGKSIVSEVENIGAGLTRELTAEFAEGTYIYSCEQMSGGDEIRGELHVSAANQVAEQDPETTSAIAAYKQFVIEQGDALLAATKSFVKAVKAKNVESAKSQYPVARSYWESIEPVAESFGDLDPKMDAREGDLDEGVAWTGWHNLEKQLWVTGLQADAPALADQLLTDTEDLVQRIATVELSLSQISNGAKELMDEVATGKVTGEEERYSHTDLWDFYANVQGAHMIVEVSRGILEKKDAALLSTLDAKFGELNAALTKMQSGDGFKLYTDLSETEIKDLAALVEALSEPLSKLTAALVK